MGPSMPKTPKILFLVEGERKERRFFEEIKRRFCLRCEIFTLKTNIFALYSKMEQSDFYLDLTSVLRTEFKFTDEEKELLRQEFTYVYLIFDFDIQHLTAHGKFNEERIRKNLEIVRKMCDYFVDESDPTIGKIYINFPMFEALFDFDSFDNENSIRRMVNFSDVPNYKLMVGNRPFSSKRLPDYADSDFRKLAKMNLIRLSRLVGLPHAVTDYEAYRSVRLAELVKAEGRFLLAGDHKIAVINTSIFFLLDYFGNNSGYFDSLLNL